MAPKTRRAIRNTSLKIRKLDKIGKKKICRRAAI